MYIYIYIYIYIYVHIYQIGPSALCIDQYVYKFSFEIFGSPKKGCLMIKAKSKFSTAESVKGTSLAFQGIDDIHSGDSLPLSVLGVGDSITDDILKEYLKNTASLLVDQPRDTFNTTSSCQTTDGRLGDTLDVIT